MKKILVILILSIICLCSCGQKISSRKDKITIESEIADSTTNSNREQALIHELEKYSYTDSTYAFANGKGITIQNSFPKGGMIEPNGTQYTDSSGKRYAFAVFWTRIINETNLPFELNINIPADSFAIFTPLDSYLRLFLPTETIAFDKLSKFNYGLTDIKSYLDANLDKASLLQKTINPNEEHIFYIVTLSYQVGGTPRAALILKEQDLYYKMSLAPNGSGKIPFGKIAFKNKADNYLGLISFFYLVSMFGLWISLNRVSVVKKQLTTMPKANRAKSTKFNGLGLFAMSAKPFGFCN